MKYKVGDILLFEKYNDTASGETCKVIKIIDSFIKLEWVDGDTTIDTKEGMKGYFTKI